MVQYIYFVKCPNCEDEHFDFFDEAKEFALGCLSKKPIITQTEVNRNDFGECTDSCDLGTVWSWEDMMREVDNEPAASVFTKDDLKTLDNDPEFDDDFFAVNSEELTEESDTRELKTWTCFYDGDDVATVEAYDEDEAMDIFMDDYSDEYFFDSWDHDWFVQEVTTEACERKPVPEGMTIEQLVEEMEENEDEVECAWCQELHPKEDCKYNENNGWICDDCRDDVVECTWCNELYDKSECRYEVDLGWLCDRCEAAIKSRGETLTFREGNYWDFLDEGVELTETSLSDIAAAANSEFGTNYSEQDILDSEGIDDLEFFNDIETQNEINAETQRKRRMKQDYAIKKAIAARNALKGTSIKESLGSDEKITFEYNDLDVVLHDNEMDRETGTYGDHECVVDYTYEVDKEDVIMDIWDHYLKEEDVTEVPGGLDALYEDEALWADFIAKRFDDLFEKYEEELKDKYRADAAKTFEESGYSYEDYLFDGQLDSYRESCDKPKSMLEELEDPDAYRFRLADCPECGASRSYDHETGICINCGFNFN